MRRNKILDAVHILVMGVGVYLTVIGILTICGFVDLDLSQMSNPDGLIAILVGTTGISVYTDRELRRRIHDLESVIYRTGTGIEPK